MWGGVGWGGGGGGWGWERRPRKLKEQSRFQYNTTHTEYPISKEQIHYKTLAEPEYSISNEQLLITLSQTSVQPVQKIV
jgi:hypothetical protein